MEKSKFDLPTVLTVGFFNETFETHPNYMSGVKESRKLR